MSSEATKKSRNGNPETTSTLTRTQTIIGIAGASGAGKSSLATSLFERVRRGYSEHDVSILHEDWYYRDLSHLSMEQRSGVNFDHPDSLDHELLVDHLQRFREGQTVEVPRYDYELHNRAATNVTTLPAKVIIVEGILVRPMFFEYIDPTRRHADLIVPRGGENPSALEVLQGHLENLLSRQPAP